ncbi:NrdJb [Haliea sp. E1-2-M8]|uniref:TSCPD domain-containing protein n=1 Tax=Haliea sp. E1-2-M8 TaxID=3064706 RepID=UPI0027206D2E|nr:NrdJb [Haliea sp. E1-2-M8]MDO8860091.1 NrdJb [Haliea sp. E1-2-M8]
MTVKIGSKIVSYKVVQPGAVPDPVAGEQEAVPASNVVHMHESFQRPERLVGSTYKVKTPMSEHALYITVNDVILNEGTEHELRRPFEVFINSKNMEHFQWVVALTRLISAVFRKGGDATFLVEELKAVFDPRGGYFKKGGVFMPSIVAEIGYAIEDHMKHIGLIESKLDEHQRKFIDDKRREIMGSASNTDTAEGEPTESDDSPFPPGASLCYKCSTRAVVLLDGCMTCLNCADSKCG